MAEFYLSDHIEFDEAAARKFLKPEAGPILEATCRRLEALTDWTPEAIEGAFAAVVEDAATKLREVAQPVRVAVTGGTKSPGIYETLGVLGRDKTLARLRQAVDHSQRAAAAS